MFLVRIHGRGGQGVVSAAELLAVAAFNEGRHAQAFPSFGSERTGAPVVLLGLSLIAALVWRGAVRFGPLAPATVPARRSLADQIRGSGHFAVRHGSGQALHAASVRALEDSARRRVAGFNALSPRDRVAALARLTGFDRESLAAAISDSRLRAPAALRRTIELLEAARRQILTAHTRLDHGTH